MLEALMMLSPVIVSVLLMIAYSLWNEKYQWPLGGFIGYAFFGGMIGLIAASLGVTIWASIYEVRYGGLAIYSFGPALVAVGELVGFRLFAGLVARKRKRTQEEI